VSVVVIIVVDKQFQHTAVEAGADGWRRWSDRQNLDASSLSNDVWNDHFCAL